MKFIVSAEITISVNTEIEARSMKEAIRLVQDRPMLSLCHQCAGGEPKIEWVTSGELDGEPKNFHVERLE